MNLELTIGHPNVGKLTPLTLRTQMPSIKSVKVDAPSFDRRLDPRTCINWQLPKDRYFRWCDMSESRKIQFAMMKLM